MKCSLSIAILYDHGLFETICICRKLITLLVLHFFYRLSVCPNVCVCVYVCARVGE